MMLVEEGGNTLLQEILKYPTSFHIVKAICSAILKMVEQELNHSSSETRSLEIDTVRPTCIFNYINFSTFLFKFAAQMAVIFNTYLVRSFFMYYINLSCNSFPLTFNR